MRRRDAAVIAALLGFSLLGYFEFPGHTWLQQDTQIWAPMLERIWNPAALGRDLVATKPHLSFTLYDETAIALRWMTRTPSFHFALAFEQMICRVLELLGVYLLARSLDVGRIASTAVAAFFGLGATIAGPAVLTFEYEPVPRGFALGFLFLAIGLAATKRWMPATCAAAIAFLFHAPTALPVWIVIAAVALHRRNFRLWIPLGAAAVLLFVCSRFQAGATEAQPFFTRIAPDWERIERLRASYNWVSTWGAPLIWQYVFLVAIALLAAWRIGPHEARWFTMGLPAIGIASIPVSYWLTEKLKWALMPQVQPARAVLWITAFAVILASIAALRAQRWWEALLWLALVFTIPMQPRVWDCTPRRAAVVVALAGLACLRVPMGAFAAAVVSYAAIPLAAGVQNYPHLHTPDLTALAAYARTGTPQDALFAFPDAGRDLYPGLFRATAIRAIYVDWKSGGQVNYFRDFALEWWQRWNSIPAPVERYRQLGIDYIVLG